MLCLTLLGTHTHTQSTHVSKSHAVRKAATESDAQHVCIGLEARQCSSRSVSPVLSYHHTVLSSNTCLQYADGGGGGSGGSHLLVKRPIESLMGSTTAPSTVTVTVTAPGGTAERLPPTTIRLRNQPQRARSAEWL